MISNEEHMSKKQFSIKWYQALNVKMMARGYALAERFPAAFYCCIFDFQRPMYKCGAHSPLLVLLWPCDWSPSRNLWNLCLQTGFEQVLKRFMLLSTREKRQRGSEICRSLVIIQAKLVSTILSKNLSNLKRIVNLWVPKSNLESLRMISNEEHMSKKQFSIKWYQALNVKMMARGYALAERFPAAFYCCIFDFQRPMYKCGAHSPLLVLLWPCAWSPSKNLWILCLQTGFEQVLKRFMPLSREKNVKEAMKFTEVLS